MDVQRNAAALAIIAFLLGGCAISPPESIFDVDRIAALDGHTKSSNTFDRLKQVANDSYANPNNAGKARDLFKVGTMFVDLRCKDYFQRLGVKSQNLKFIQKEVQLTGGVAAAIQGLTGVSTKAVAVTAAMFGFGGSSFDNYGESYLFAPDVSGVAALVNSAKSAFQSRVATVEMTYEDAITLIADYEALCEVQTIRRLVNESLAAAKPTSTTTTTTPTPPGGTPESTGGISRVPATVNKIIIRVPN